MLKRLWNSIRGKQPPSASAVDGAARGPTYAVVLTINHESVIGLYIANTKRPYIVPEGKRGEAYNALSKLGNMVVMGDKEMLLNNPFDLCPDDFKELLEIPGMSNADLSYLASTTKISHHE